MTTTVTSESGEKNSTKGWRGGAVATSASHGKGENGHAGTSFDCLLSVETLDGPDSFFDSFLDSVTLTALRSGVVAVDACDTSHKVVRILILILVLILVLVRSLTAWTVQWGSFTQSCTHCVEGKVADVTTNDDGLCMITLELDCECWNRRAVCTHAQHAKPFCRPRFFELPNLGQKNKATDIFIL